MYTPSVLTEENISMTSVINARTYDLKVSGFVLVRPGLQWCDLIILLIKLPIVCTVVSIFATAYL